MNAFCICVNGEEGEDQYSFEIPYGCYWNSGSTKVLEIEDECSKVSGDHGKVDVISYTLWWDTDGSGGLGSNCTLLETQSMTNVSETTGNI